MRPFLLPTGTLLLSLAAGSACQGRDDPSVASPLPAAARPLQPNEGTLPPPGAYPAAGPGCEHKVKLTAKVTGRTLTFAETFQCELLVQSCGNPDQYVSGVRKTGAANCDDYYAAAAALQGREICCDCDSGCQGPEAAQTFERLYTGLVGPDTSLTPTAKKAISRFLSNCEAAKLLDDIANMPCPWDGSAPGCRMGQYIRFKLRFRDRDPADLEAGSVDLEDPYPNPEVSDPAALKRFVYTVSVTNQVDGSAVEGHAFPTPSDPCFSYAFSEGSSEMAAAIYHELLHIWWMNKYQTDLHNSGHGTDLGGCANYQPEFARRLKDFYQGMDTLEKCLK